MKFDDQIQNEVPNMLGALFFLWGTAEIFKSLVDWLRHQPPQQLGWTLPGNMAAGNLPIFAAVPSSPQEAFSPIFLTEEANARLEERIRIRSEGRRKIRELTRKINADSERKIRELKFPLLSRTLLSSPKSEVQLSEAGVQHFDTVPHNDAIQQRANVTTPTKQQRKRGRPSPVSAYYYSHEAELSKLRTSELVRVLEDFALSARIGKDPGSADDYEKAHKSAVRFVWWNLAGRRKKSKNKTNL
jgi:hypothetical protein